MQADALKRKVGPLPVWAWAVLGAVVVFYVFRHFKTGGASTAATSTQPTANTSTTGTGSAGGTSSPPASGQGSAIDQSTASLLGQMSGNLAYVNSNLVQGLLGSVSAIEGLGTTALQQEGQIATAVIYQQGSWGGTDGSRPSSQPAPTYSPPPSPSPTSSSTPAPPQIKYVYAPPLDSPHGTTPLPKGGHTHEGGAIGGRI